MRISQSLEAYLVSANARRSAGSQSALPEEIDISLSEALSILASQDKKYSEAALVRAKDQISHPLLENIAKLCVRFGDILAPIRDFMMATSGFPLAEIRSPIRDLVGINRKRSMVGTTLWVCDKFTWPVSKSGNPLSPLMQINLQELRPPLLEVVDFPPLLVQVWGDHITPVVRTIPVLEIEGSSPVTSVPDWKNEHLYYAVKEDASGSASDVEEQTDLLIYGEYIIAGKHLEFTVCRDVYSFESIRYEIEQMLEKYPSLKRPDAHADAAEAMQYLSDAFEEQMEEFYANYTVDDTGLGYFFGDLKLRQSSYSGWLSDHVDWHGGGWRTLYNPFNQGEDPPGISILWDGQLALFWRVRDGVFEFRAEVDR